MRSGPRGAGVVAALLLTVSFVVFALTSATTPTKTLNLDAWSANYASWTIARTGRPWIDGDRLSAFDHNPIRSQWVMDPAPNGHTVIARSPGVVAVAIPAYWLFQPTRMTTLPGGLTASLLVAAAVSLLFLALKELMPQRQAVLSALVFGFSTPVWSIAADGVWPHTVTVLGICGMSWAAATRRWWLVGLFGGLTLWGRVNGALIVAILGLAVGWRRRSPAIMVKVGSVSAGFLVLLSIWTRWMYGTWNPTGSYEMSGYENYAQTQAWDLVNQLGFWISPDRGILVWTPVIVLLLPAVRRSWRVLPDWARTLLLSGVAYTVIQGFLNGFTGGDVFYGYRYGLEGLACLTPAVALSAHQMGRVARRLIGPVLGIQFFAIGLGATTNSFFLPKTEVWQHNAFEIAIRHAGMVGWLTLVLAVGLGVLAQRIWSDWATSGYSSATVTAEK